MKTYRILSASLLSNPERVAIIQPRVGAAAPTLGMHPKRPNPVRVEAANGIAPTNAFPRATWERGEGIATNSGGPATPCVHVLSGWPQATAGSPMSLATGSSPVTSRSLREPAQHTHAWLAGPPNIKTCRSSNAAAGSPERAAILQPRVGAAAPTLGMHPKRPNPVRVEEAMELRGQLRSQIEFGNEETGITEPTTRV